MCVVINSRYQTSKAIKGSVFEYMMNGTKNDYVVISDTEYNMNNGMAICCMITAYTDKDKNNKYAVEFETIVGSGIKQKMCILTNTQYIIKVFDLKVYKYHLPDELIHQINLKYMDIIFGKRLYSIEECRAAVAEDDIRLRVKYENNVPKIIEEEKKEAEIIQLENSNASLEDMQAYYAAQLMEDTELNNIIADIPDPKQSETKVSGKTEFFNPVLSSSNFIEEEKPDKKKKPKATKKKAKIEKSKTGASIVNVSGKKKQKKEPEIKVEVTETISSTVKRPYIDRSAIWEQPELFLLDKYTKTKEEMLKTYSIGTASRLDTMVWKCKKLCEERGIDISFMTNKEV